MWHKPSQEDQNLYKIALSKYRAACSAYKRAQLAFKLIAIPSAEEEFVMFKLQQQYKKDCKEYSDARMEYNKAVLAANAEKITLPHITLDLIASQMMTMKPGNEIYTEEEKEQIRKDIAQARSEMGANTQMEKLEKMEIPEDETPFQN